MMDKRRVSAINQGWENALKKGATLKQCQSALIQLFLHHRPLKIWPALEPWYFGPATRELVGKDQVFFDVVCDSLEKVLRREAMHLINGEISEEKSDQELSELFPALNHQLLLELRNFSRADLSGRLA